MTDIKATLAARGSNYGAYKHDAAICMELVDVMQAQSSWNKLPPYMKHALTLFAVKIARILGGRPEYVDNWHDIAGYATLVEQELLIDE